MSERIDLDAVQTRYQQAVVASDPVPIYDSLQDVPALVAELRELRKDQDNWFAYLRWRAEQDEKEEQATGP